MIVVLHVQKSIAILPAWSTAFCYVTAVLVFRSGRRTDDLAGLPKQNDGEDLTKGEKSAVGGVFFQTPRPRRHAA